MNDGTALALVPAPARPRTLPPLLRRPDSAGAIARLSWAPPAKKANEEDDGSGVARWRLEGSPAVVLLAERLFPGAICRRNDFVSWPAVPALFEDLLMLMHRYPIEVDRTAQAVWNEQWADVVSSAEARGGVAVLDARRTDREAGFTGTLLPFQEDGLQFMFAGRRTVCAFDMGLGKSPLALAFLDRVGDWPAVIVCQPHVQRHWLTMFARFLRGGPADPRSVLPFGLTWLHLQGTKPEKLRDARADIYLVHYLVVWAWERWLRDRGVRSVIFDEVQEVRHEGTSKYVSCEKLARSARYVSGLSGTPIYNKGIEIYNVFNCLNRGALGVRHEFQRHWCSATDPQLVEDPVLLGQYLRDRGMMIRRRKDEVLKDLPEKRRVIEPIDADNEKFAELVREAQKKARDAFAAKDPFDRGRMEAEAISGARMATGIAKAPAVVLFLRGLMEAEEPTLVFAHHHAVVDAILESLGEFSPVCISGRETPAMKDRAQRAFMAGETNLCVISLRCATGLDGFQHRGRVAVHAELDWSPAVHRQAEDRLHRMGQRNAILAYYLLTDVGTDPFVMAALGIKESQYLGLMHDAPESAEDRARAEAAADEHKAGILRMLRGGS